MGKAVIINISIEEQLSNYFIKNNTKICTYSEISKKIKEIRKINGVYDWDREVYRNTLSSYVSKARIFLERKHKKTLWNIKNVGWRIATPRETAYYSMYAVKRVLSLAERVNTLEQIVDSKYIPDSVQKIFLRTGKSLKQFSNNGKGFLKLWNQVRLEAKKQLIKQSKVIGNEKRYKKEN